MILYFLSLFKIPIAALPIAVPVAPAAIAPAIPIETADVVAAPRVMAERPYDIPATPISTGSAGSGIIAATVAMIATVSEPIHTAHATLPVAFIFTTFFARSPSISIVSTLS